MERLCKVGAEHGPRGFPRNARDRSILMHSIVLELDSSRSYTQREIDAALRAWKTQLAPAIETDHVTLRRLLVDRGLLDRTADGSSYRVGFPPKSVAFDLAIWDLDLRGTVAAHRERLARRPRCPKRGGA